MKVLATVPTEASHTQRDTQSKWFLTIQNKSDGDVKGDIAHYRGS